MKADILIQDCEIIEDKNGDFQLFLPDFLNEEVEIIVRGSEVRNSSA